MIYTVSTVKDTLANVTRFVDGNLRAGADLMFVFSEDADQEVSAYLSDHERVVHIPATPQGGHWDGKRPTNIYIRQKTNANLIRTLLASFSWATWLFHIDGDEILDIDRDELELIGPDVQVVRLKPLESVAAMEAGWDHYFKYPLSEPNLALLFALGVISKPSLGGLYNGHIQGKVGVRPSLDLGIGIHNATIDDETLPAFESDRLRMLHFDSYNADEFVRKWMAKINNTGANQRGSRRAIRQAIFATTNLTHLPEARRAELLREIYRRHIADEVELLSELGFLTLIDKSRHEYSPRQHEPAQLAALHELLGKLREMNPRVFNPNNGLDKQRRALDDALGSLSLAGKS